MKLQLIMLIAIVGLLFGCNRNERHPVPYFQFDVTINLNLPTYNSLLGVGGWAYVNGIGSRGVVVYRRSVGEFVAFDRHSPADPEGVCPTPLVTDPDNFLRLLDDCSGGIFSLFDGSPWQDSSYKEWGLRSYLTFYDGGAALRIYNP
jgi:hypothetical protein